MIENHAWLDAGYAALRIELDDLRHVFRKIKHHRDIAALPREGSAATAAKHWCAVFAADRDRGDHFVRIARQQYPNWHLPVV